MRLFLGVLFLAFTSNANAAPPPGPIVPPPMPPPPQSWSCYAVDSLNRVYTGQAWRQADAESFALEDCQRSGGHSCRLSGCSAD